MKARFPISGVFDRSRPTRGTLTIDRALGLLEVRPLRRRRSYILPLNTVAEIVVAKVIKAELGERATAEDRKRRGRLGVR